MFAGHRCNSDRRRGRANPGEVRRIDFLKDSDGVVDVHVREIVKPHHHRVAPMQPALPASRTNAPRPRVTARMAWGISAGENTLSNPRPYWRARDGLCVRSSHAGWQSRGKPRVGREVRRATTPRGRARHECVAPVPRLYGRSLWVETGVFPELHHARGHDEAAASISVFMFLGFVSVAGTHFGS